jgi:hypothetical protein
VVKAGFSPLFACAVHTTSLSVMQTVYQLGCVLHGKLLLQQLFAVVPFCMVSPKHLADHH